MGLRGIVKLALAAALVAALLIGLRFALSREANLRFRVLMPGFDFAEFKNPSKADDGDSIVRVARIDPEKFSVALYSAGEPGESGRPRTVREWAEEKNLSAAINASMFQEDGLTGVSLMRKRGYVNNGRVTKHQSVFLFDPLEPGLPPVRMVDLDDGGEGELKKYGSAVQSIRMLSGKDEITWEKQEKRWPASLIGIDQKGRVLLIHTNSSYSMHDLVEFLLTLPIGIQKLQYAEGGKEAQMAIDAGIHKGFYAPTGIGWTVPNVIGFSRKDQD